MTVGVSSYITTAEYEAYADARGIIPNFATLDADVILSADFINTYYTMKPGYALPTDDADKIAEIKKAALKAMELQQKGELTLNLAGIAAGVVSSESKSLEGVGSKSTTYEAGTRPTWKPRTPALDLLMRPFLSVGGGLVRG
jgi:hypothetical protein